MALQLIDARTYVGKDKLAEIAGYLLSKFETAQKARSSQLDGNYLRWMDNYSAKPYEEVRTTPWYRASNFIPQLIRMHVDILTARMVGIISGTKPFWKPTSAMDAVTQKQLEVLGSWMEFESFQRMDMFDTIHSGVYRCFKTGTNIYKALWQDLGSNSFQSLVGRSQDGSPSFKTVGREGLQFEPVPFEDFYVYPINVANLSKVKIKFHRLRFDKDDIERRQKLGVWDSIACTELLRQGDFKQDPARESQAAEAGIVLTRDTVLPFNVLECWFDHMMANGQIYKLVAVLNPQTVANDKAILRFYFNPDSRGEDPFIDQRPMPREDFFYGYSVPEILEQAQEEQAQIHNHRRDANTIANNPGWLKKRLAGVPNPSSEWFPGRVFEVDNMDDVAPLQFSGSYNAMIEEEAFLLGLSDKYTGMGSPTQAMGSGILDGKRGVYSAQGTMAMLSQGTDRPDLYLRQFRAPFHRMGRLMKRYYAGYASTIPFELWGENGKILQQILYTPEPDSYDPVYFQIGASDGSANKEVDRTNLLLMSNTMAGYYNQLFQAVSTVGSLPEDHPVREILLKVLDGAKDLADRLLYVFDIGDRKKLIPDIREVLGGGGQNLPTSAEGAEQAGLPNPGTSVSQSGLEALVGGINALPR